MGNVPSAHYMQQKLHYDWQRKYRSQCQAQAHECVFQVLVEETDLRVVACKNLGAAMLNVVHALRADIKSWVALHPEFRYSLTPVTVSSQAPNIIQRMAHAAQLVGVGPFAAVAGAIAQMTAEAFVSISPDLIIENGGDVYMYSRHSRRVGLLSDPQHGAQLALDIKAEDFPLSLCASSATIGHSLSFGCGDIAVIRAQDACFADAAATALGNQLRGAGGVEKALDFAASLAHVGVEGAFVQCAGKIGLWGNMEIATV